MAMVRSGRKHRKDPKIRLCPLGVRSGPDLNSSHVRRMDLPFYSGLLDSLMNVVRADEIH